MRMSPHRNHFRNESNHCIRLWLFECLSVFFSVATSVHFFDCKLLKHLVLTTSRSAVFWSIYWFWLWWQTQLISVDGIIRAVYFTPSCLCCFIPAEPLGWVTPPCCSPDDGISLHYLNVKKKINKGLIRNVQINQIVFIWERDPGSKIPFIALLAKLLFHASFKRMFVNYFYCPCYSVWIASLHFALHRAKRLTWQVGYLHSFHCHWSVRRLLFHVLRGSNLLKFIPLFWGLHLPFTACH